MDKNKIQTKEVWSAGKFHLIIGITGLLGIIILEGLVIREFFISALGDALCLAICMQAVALVLVAFAVNLYRYIHRVKFNLYYCKLENGIDIDYIKENYDIVNISTTGIMFIKEEDYQYFSIWNMLIDKYYDYDSLFKNSEENYAK